MWVITPSRSTWRRQPQGAVDVDWAHPLARDLLGWWGVTQDQPYLNYVTKARSLTRSSTSNAIAVDSELGTVLSTASSAYFKDTGVSAGTNIQAWTLACWARPTTLSGATQRLIEWDNENTDVVINLSINSTDYPVAETYASGVSAKATGATKVVAGKWQFISGISYATNSRAVVLGSEKATSTAGSTNYTTPYQVTLAAQLPYGPANVFSGLLASPKVWKRALSDDEIAQDREHPWLLIARRRRVVYSLGAGAQHSFTFIGCATASADAAAGLGAATFAD